MQSLYDSLNSKKILTKKEIQSIEKTVFRNEKEMLTFASLILIHFTTLADKKPLPFVKKGTGLQLDIASLPLELQSKLFYFTSLSKTEK